MGPAASIANRFPSAIERAVNTALNCLSRHLPRLFVAVAVTVISWASTADAQAPAPAPVGPPTVAGCAVFPADNEWNRVVAGDPVDPASDRYLAGMKAGARHITADFSASEGYGIPWVVVSGTQPRVPVSFEYDSESDAGPYPIPPDAPIEKSVIEDGGDRHILVIDRDSCVLYETWHSRRNGEGWTAGSGAKFDLRTNAQRTVGFTSADAAGLPIFPGLLRRDEVLSGRIAHALRFTVTKTQAAYVWPATHFASSSEDASLPPMGLRLRLKSNFDLSSFGPEARTVLTALQQYGMFVADNGPDWFVSGEVNEAWDEQFRQEMARVPASAFEVVQHRPLSR
jgi:hypothetical protein